MKANLRRLAAWIGRCTQTSFCVASLIGLLSILAAIPVLQLITLGYLFHVAGTLAGGGTVRQSLLGLKAAGKVGLAALALFVVSLPTQLLVHYQSVATLVDPATTLAEILRPAAITVSLLALFYLMWAWVRGGRLVHYLWPQPVRFAKQAWRPSTWWDAPDRLWDFTGQFQIPQLFWLGLRGAIGTLIWLIPAMIIIAATRQGETGMAGLLAGLSLTALGFAMLYLPMLQANFGAENRLSALFEIRRIRADFRHAPWTWLGAMMVALVLTPIPLYLLKIEATPQEYVWLPCLVFVAFILPARIATGLALRRARRRTSRPIGKWAFISRWTVRTIMPLVVAIYLMFVYVSQYISWEGLQTWVQQHAILVPVPFVGI